MKKAIIIPIYLRLSEPKELPYIEGLRLAKRAIESLKILEDQNFTLILPESGLFGEKGMEESKGMPF